MPPNGTRAFAEDNSERNGKNERNYFRYRNFMR